MATKKTKKIDTPIDNRETFVSIQKNFADSDIPVSEKLMTLYSLQQVDSDIDKILQLRGELPLEVSTLEGELSDIKVKEQAVAADIEAFTTRIAASKHDIVECEAQIEKYRNQYFGDGNPRIDYYIDQWLDSIDVKRQVITDYIAGPKPNKWRQYIEMPSDELVKRRFLNTEAGLVLCSMKTLGWSPGSNACSECEFTAKCKEITTKRYPELMRLRLEDGNN